MIKECKKCRNSVAEVPRNRCYCPDPDDNSKCMLFKSMTNGDRIRAMTDEELVDTLIFWEGDWGRWVTDAGNFYKEDYGSFDEAHQSALKAELEWLKQPCEEVNHDL